MSNAIILLQEVAAVSGKNANPKAGRKATKKERENMINISLSQSRSRKGKPDSPKVNVRMGKSRSQKPPKAEPLPKEEGEMSDNEEVYEQFKEQKWMEWCEDVMVEEIKTLNRLHKLQTTSANLPKEKVDFFLVVYISLVKSYLIHLHFINCRFSQRFEITCNFLEGG